MFPARSTIDKIMKVWYNEVVACLGLFFVILG